MIQDEHKHIGDRYDMKGAGQLEIVYFTDPLCCWSWAIEPQFRKLQYHLREELSVRYCMGGLLPDWKTYHDEVNAVSRPMQMGPVWMHAKEVSGMPMQTTVWMKDPPASSYPSCIAVKCAFLQSEEAGVRYLRLAREALMLKGLNIARRHVLVEIAERLQSEMPAFEPEQFKDDLDGDAGVDAFRRDLNEIQTKNIRRFPSMIIKNADGKAVIITGYRPYHSLLESVRQVYNVPNGGSIDEEAYTSFWKSLTQREVEEIEK